MFTVPQDQKKVAVSGGSTAFHFILVLKSQKGFNKGVVEHLFKKCFTNFNDYSNN